MGQIDAPSFLSLAFILVSSFTVLVMGKDPGTSISSPKSAYVGRSEELSEQQRLYRDLFKNYQKDLRPTRNDSTVLNVSMHLWFKQVLKVDEIDQILTIYCWTEQYWNDELLTWDPDEYEGVSVLHIPVQRIWRPDILVYNNADMNINENEISTNSVVNYTGDIICFRAIITKVTCNLDMTFFPFDQQNCSMMFASWSYDGSKVMIGPKQATNNLVYYIENTEWKLLNFSYKANIKFYDCCPEPYPDITYTFILERNPSYYILNLIIPSVFITVVTMVGFFTPYSSTGENTEKVSLGVTALLSLAIILLMVADKMPATSKVIPLIGKYYIGLIWLIFAATIITTVTLRLQSKGNAGKPLSPETKKLFFNYIARFLFMKVDLPPKSFSQPTAPTEATNVNGGVVSETSLLLENEHDQHGSSRGSYLFSNHVVPKRKRNLEKYGIQPRRISQDSSAQSRRQSAAQYLNRRFGAEIRADDHFQRNATVIADLPERNRLNSSPAAASDIYVSAAGKGPCAQKCAASKCASCVCATALDSALAASQKAQYGMSAEFTVRIVDQMGKIREVLRSLDHRLEGQAFNRAVRREWEQLSRVCERILMILFVFITVLFAVLMLHSHGQESFIVNL